MENKSMNSEQSHIRPVESEQDYQKGLVVQQAPVVENNNESKESVQDSHTDPEEQSPTDESEGDFPGNPSQEESEKG